MKRIGSNSVGNDTRGIMRFLRENGIKPTVANVEKMGREVRRSETENERVVQRAKELGGPATRDERGRDVHKVVAGIVRRDLGNRPK